MYMPRRTSRHRTRLRWVAGQAVVVLAAVFCYFQVRGLTSTAPEVAYRHADELVRIERDAGIDVEGVVQAPVLAYHSLEDRIAKRVFATATTSIAPRDLPVVPPELAPKFQLLTRGAELATESEVALNSRAKPVRLRAVERIAVNGSREYALTPVDGDDVSAPFLVAQR